MTCHSDLRKAAEMALKRLDFYLKQNNYAMDSEAIEALRQALAQSEQDDGCVAIVNEGMGGIEWLGKPLPDDTPLYAAPLNLEASVLAEREACAKVCDLMDEHGWKGAEKCAKAIRARSKND